MEEKPKISYLKIFFLYGLVYATLPIIFTEITWDALAKLIGLEGLLKELIGSFLRAALLEETFKFIAFKCADKEYHFKTEKEFMLAAGMIGLMYCIVEKIVSGSVIAIVLGILFPMHLLWQMEQGRHFFAYRKAKEKGNMKSAKKEFFMATIFIFLFHGCWDAILSLIEYFMNDASSDSIGTIFFIIFIVVGIVYIIKSIKSIRRVLREDKGIEVKSKTKKIK